jgi:aarF domain-containing kinase
VRFDLDLHPGNVLVREYYVPKETSPFRHFNIFENANQKHLKQQLHTRKMDEFVSTTTPFDVTYNHNMEMKRQIVFLDAGIAFQLDHNDQQNLIDLFRAVVMNNGKEAGRLMIERAKYERCSTMPNGIEEFSMGIHHIVAEFHDRRKDGLTLGAVRIGSLLTRVLDLCRIYGVEIDPAMANVIISTLVLEGLGRSLEPSLNLIDFALPFIMGRGKI